MKSGLDSLSLTMRIQARSQNIRCRHDGFIGNICRWQTDESSLHAPTADGNMEWKSPIRRLVHAQQGALFHSKMNVEASVLTRHRLKLARFDS